MSNRGGARRSCWVLEDINHWHQAFNKGTTPVKILVVFMGEEGKPTSINAQ
jgi:hypothetical protein